MASFGYQVLGFGAGGRAPQDPFTADFLVIGTISLRFLIFGILKKSWKFA